MYNVNRIRKFFSILIVLADAIRLSVDTIRKSMWSSASDSSEKKFSKRKNDSGDQCFLLNFFKGIQFFLRDNINIERIIYPYERDVAFRSVLILTNVKEMDC